MYAYSQSSGKLVVVVVVVVVPVVVAAEFITTSTSFSTSSILFLPRQLTIVTLGLLLSFLRLVLLLPLLCLSRLLACPFRLCRLCCVPLSRHRFGYFLVRHSHDIEFVILGVQLS